VSAIEGSNMADKNSGCIAAIVGTIVILVVLAFTLHSAGCSQTNIQTIIFLTFLAAIGHFLDRKDGKNKKEIPRPTSIEINSQKIETSTIASLIETLFLLIIIIPIIAIIYFLIQWKLGLWKSSLLFTAFMGVFSPFAALVCVLLEKINNNSTRNDHRDFISRMNAKKALMAAELAAQQDIMDAQQELNENKNIEYRERLNSVGIYYDGGINTDLIEWLLENRHYLQQLKSLYKRNIYVDEFGDRNFAEWDRVLRKFIATKIPVGLRKLADPDRITVLIECIKNETEESYDLTNDPIEFEIQCKRILEQHGWDCETTPYSGDQGADIIAKRDKINAVIQCKKYIGSVGNASVQEVYAAKTHYGCNLAAVVTTGKFTTSARQLAESTSVNLIDFRDWTLGRRPTGLNHLHFLRHLLPSDGKPKGQANNPSVAFLSKAIQQARSERRPDQ